MGMRLDIENLLKRHRRVIEPAADAVVWAGPTFRRWVSPRSSVSLEAQTTLGWAVSLYQIRWKNASLEETGKSDDRDARGR